jgi:hypothetical protein
MKFLLVYPAWPKLEHQTPFHLPPHGPVVMAAEIPAWVDVTFVDLNLEPLPAFGGFDFVGISTMLTSQLPHAFTVADQARAAGKKVIFGGIASMLHAEEVQRHCDAHFLGEV